MKTSPSTKLALRFAIIAAVFELCAYASAQDKKLTVEELIAHHLDSIGSAQARASAKNRVVSGTVKLISRVGTAGNVDGEAAIASSGEKLRYSMKFPSPQYPGEQFAYDGSKVLTGFLPSGRRSPLSFYLEQQNVPLKDGLLGGTLSTAWAMLRVGQLKPKLEYRGLKKIEGRQLHEVSYRAAKGSPDLKVSLFFDVTTFQHLRTEYEFKVPAQLGQGPNESTRFQENYYQIVESFDDFSAVDGLMVPHQYRLQLNVQTSRGSIVFDWNVAIRQVMHNQVLDEQIFSR
ncbi:MAG TPA: hypothetical protein VKF81_14870 [Blastocatellia bacterium]|nr:hypothetical protein [Blastocatellia bacterium]